MNVPKKDNVYVGGKDKHSQCCLVLGHSTLVNYGLRCVHLKFFLLKLITSSENSSCGFLFPVRVIFLQRSLERRGYRDSYNKRCKLIYC